MAATDGAFHRASLEIDPVRTLLVLGPQVTCVCLSEAKSTLTAPSFLSYKTLVEKGIQKSVELERSNDYEDSRSRREMLLQNAYELEPSFAAYKVVESLKAYNQYEPWIKESFHGAREIHFDFESSRTLQHIMHLRKRGVRLVYTHYDDILARALGLPVVLMEEEENTRKWSQGFPALLHLHGVFTNPYSLKMDCLAYQSAIGNGKSAGILREQFQSRSVIFIGYDNQFMDPFLPKIIQTFATPLTMPTSLPLLLTTLKKFPAINGILPMTVDSNTSLYSLLTISPVPLGVAPINDCAHPVSMQFVCSTKDGILELFEVLQYLPNIVTNVTQRGQDQYILDLQMSRSILQKLWSQVFSFGLASKLNSLFTIELLGSFVLRMNHKQGIETTKVSTPTIVSTSLLGTPTTIWKPSLATLPHFTIPPTLIPAATDTHKAQHHLLNQATIATKQFQEKVMHRMKSENELEMSREDKITKAINKNGYLIHQSSAPNFPLGTSHALLFGSSSFAVPNPPVVMGTEDQLQQYKSHSNSEGGNKRSTFEDKKTKFIKEAQEWSKQVETKIGNKETETEVAEAMVAMTPSAGRNLYTVSMASPIATPTSPKGAFPRQQQQMFYSQALNRQPHIFNISSHPSIIPSTIMAPPISLLTSLSKASPTGGDTPLSAAVVPNVMPKSLPFSTPALTPDQKFVYMMQDGRLVAAPFHAPISTPPTTKMDEGGVSLTRVKIEDGMRNPKRTDSPNSDPESYRPPLKRRRSTSLPDVTQLKSTPSSPELSSPAPSPSPTSLPVTSLAGGIAPGKYVTPPDSSYVALLNNNHATPPIFFSNVPLPQTTLQNIEQQNGDSEMTNESQVDPTNIPPSPEDGALQPVPPGRGPIQLWQFLLDLLLTHDKSHLIQWTGNGYEFHIVQPEEIAKLWGARKNKPRMNYDKLSRGLRYYYSKGIMDKVPGKKLTFKYTCDIQQYILQRSNSLSNSHPSSN